jgi:hypothetical protein
MTTDIKELTRSCIARLAAMTGLELHLNKVNPNMYQLRARRQQRLPDTPGTPAAWRDIGHALTRNEIYECVYTAIQLMEELKK